MSVCLRQCDLSGKKFADEKKKKKKKSDFRTSLIIAFLKGAHF